MTIESRLNQILNNAKALCPDCSFLIIDDCEGMRYRTRNVAKAVDYITGIDAGLGINIEDANGEHLGWFFTCLEYGMDDDEVVCDCTDNSFTDMIIQDSYITVANGHTVQFKDGTTYVKNSHEDGYRKVNNYMMKGF